MIARALTFILSLVATPILACETALILAIDVSSSISSGEYRFQVDGLADALLEPAVQNALLRDQIALAVVQWSGHNEQDLSISWRRMLSLSEIQTFASRVRDMDRKWDEGKTAIGNAIIFSVEQFDAVRDCKRQVIDVSGDGASNAGTDTSAQRFAAQEAGVEINGLAIDRVGFAITAFFERFVRTRGGFVLTSHGYSDYPRVMRAKLLRELVKPSS